MGAWAAAAQKDLKRVFAYSSRQSPRLLPARHLRARRSRAFNDAAGHASQAAALNGVILQMFNHGLTAAALFWFVAMLQTRTGGHRGIDDFGGLRKPAPVLAGLMGIALFSSLGLPGLNGFVGEFLIFRGVFPLAWVAATVSILGLLVTAAVILTVIQKVFTGPRPRALRRISRPAHRRAFCSRARHRPDDPHRHCAATDREQREPNGSIPAGALEILDARLDNISLLCRRAA